MESVVQQDSAVSVEIKESVVSVESVVTKDSAGSVALVETKEF